MSSADSDIPIHNRFLQIKGHKSRTSNDDENLLTELQSNSGENVSKLIIESSGRVLAEYKRREDAADALSKGLSSRVATLSYIQPRDVEDILSFMYNESCLRLGGIPPTTSRDSLLYFLENEKKSGGGQVVDLQLDNKGCATLIFDSSQVADRLMKKRNITFMQATLSVTKPRLTFDTRARICVTGIKETTAEDTLEDFFVNMNRSGGGPIEEIDYSKHARRAVITFTENNVSERVMKRSNLELENARLTITLPAGHRKHPSLPIYYVNSSQQDDQDELENLPAPPPRPISSTAAPPQPPRRRSQMQEPPTLRLRDRPKGGEKLKFKSFPKLWTKEDVKEYFEQKCGFGTESIAMSQTENSATVVFGDDIKYAAVCQGVLVNPIPGRRLFVERVTTSTLSDDTVPSTSSDDTQFLAVYAAHPDNSGNDESEKEIDEHQYQYISHSQDTEDVKEPADESEEDTSVQAGTMRITLVKGNMTDENVDTIVNTTSCGLQLDRGKVSAEIFRAAGNSIQTECNTKYPDGLNEGEFAITFGGQLGCRRIYHCVCPRWDGIKGSGKKVLQKLVCNLLTRAEFEEAKSIAIPALGTGLLGFPPVEVAKIIYEEIRNFKKKVKNPVLRNVHVVVFPTDTKTLEHFEEYFKESGVVIGESIFEKPVVPPRRGAGGATMPDDSAQSSDSREITLLLGSLKLTVKNGDITRETTDAITNIINPDLLFTGNLSKSIEAAAGMRVIEEYKQLGTITKDFAVTQAGNLPSSFIFHIKATDNLDSLRKVIRHVLEEADQMRHRSISFPALDTGSLHSSPEDIAKQMYRAVKEYSKKKPKTLRQVNICILEEDVTRTFTEAITKEQPKDKSAFAKIIGAFKKPSPQFHDAEKGQKKPEKNVMKDTSVTLEPTNDDDDISQLQHPRVPPRKSELVQSPAPKCHRHGIVQRVSFDENITRTSEDIFGHFDDFSDDLPPPLPDRRSHTLPGKSTGLPPMMKHSADGDLFHKICLPKTGKEYNDIVTKYGNGPGADIVQIERIDNSKLKEMYEVIKFYMKASNEQTLWHGTTEGAVDQISANGFNRSWCGKNATLFGKGCYFSTEADFALNYATPDSRCYRYLFLCKVLTGEYTKGEEDMLEPPAKNTMNKYVLYDSVVNEIDNPTIYVVFKDGAAYPEYLLTLKYV